MSPRSSSTLLVIVAAVHVNVVPIIVDGVVAINGIVIDVLVIVIIAFDIIDIVVWLFHW